MPQVKPYVYRLVHKVSGQFYIGYREANSAPAQQDLPKYQSSSNVVKEMGFENFDWEILCEFDDADGAYLMEQKLISDHIKNPLCLNKHYVREGGLKFVCRYHTDETRKKMSMANSGRKLSDAEIEERRNRRHSQETKLKQRRAAFQREPWPEDVITQAKQKMSDKAKQRVKHTPPPSSAKKFKLVSPSGEVFEGEGLAAFCKEYGLTQSSMAAVCRGEYKQHKEWTGEYL